MTTEILAASSEIMMASTKETRRGGKIISYHMGVTTIACPDLAYGIVEYYDANGMTLAVTYSNYVGVVNDPRVAKVIVGTKGQVK